MLLWAAALAAVSPLALFGGNAIEQLSTLVRHRNADFFNTLGSLLSGLAVPLQAFAFPTFLNLGWWGSGAMLLAAFALAHRHRQRAAE